MCLYVARGEQIRRVNQIGKADSLQGAPQSPVHLVPMITHEAAVADRARVLCSVNAAINRDGAFHCLDYMHQRYVFGPSKQLISAGGAASRFQKTGRLEAVCDLCNGRLI